MISRSELNELARMIGIGALKYYLKVDPKKIMLFNPGESIGPEWENRPFIQYTHARICSLLRKAGVNTLELTNYNIDFIHEAEKEILRMLYDYPVRSTSCFGINPSYWLITPMNGKTYTVFTKTTPVFKEMKMTCAIFVTISLFRPSLPSVNL